MTNSIDQIVPSSDAETDRMEEMEGRDSELEQLSTIKSESEEYKESPTIEEHNHGSKRPHEESESEASDTSAKKKLKSEFNIERVEVEENPQQKKAVKEEESKHNEGDKTEEEDDDQGNEEDNEEEEDEEGGTDQKSDEDNDVEDEEEKRIKEEKRVAAMNDLKSIEIKFAQLKNKLYNTQLQKLEFELKLCEENQHPELLDYLKMVDEDFQKKQQRLLNEQKYKLKCLDIQTRSSRVQIHQQFMKQCQDLKSKEILEITTDWYDINRERRSMDLMSMNLPEYYQYFGYLTPQTVDHYLPDLVERRNGQFRELSELQGLIKYKKVMPSGLNYLNGCSISEQEQDFRDLGLL